MPQSNSERSLKKRLKAKSEKLSRAYSLSNPVRISDFVSAQVENNYIVGKYSAEFIGDFKMAVADLEAVSPGKYQVRDLLMAWHRSGGPAGKV
jgi:predicted DNA-binding protein